MCIAFGGSAPLSKNFSRADKTYKYASFIGDAALKLYL